jgi:hypothetical protein
VLKERHQVDKPGTLFDEALTIYRRIGLSFDYGPLFLGFADLLVREAVTLAGDRHFDEASPRSKLRAPTSTVTPFATSSLAT